MALRVDSAATAPSFIRGGVAGLWSKSPGGRPPRPLRGPFTRWPRASDASLALLTLGVMVTIPPLTIDRSTSFAGRAADVPVTAWGLVVLSAAVLYWRRRHPVVVLVTVITVETLWLVLALPAVNSGPGGLIAPYSVGRYVRAEPYRYAAVGFTLAFFVLGGTLVGGAPSLALALSLGWMSWYVGRRVRMRGEYLALLQDRAEHLERERQAEAERAVAEERSRIARELHDIVAHAMSVITVQAGVGAHVASDRPDKAAEALRVIQATGREALEEMRRLLGVLRGEHSGSDEGPQPGLEDLPALVSQMNDSGMDVSLQVQGDARSVPTSLALSAYRVAQEALTNAAKHAAGSPVRLAVSYQPRSVVVEVEDQGGEPTATVGSGLGLVGMKERVALFSGSLEAGSLPNGGFRVRAMFPIDGLVR